MVSKQQKQIWQLLDLDIFYWWHCTICPHEEILEAKASDPELGWDWNSETGERRCQETKREELRLYIGYRWIFWNGVVWVTFHALNVMYCIASNPCFLTSTDFSCGTRVSLALVVRGFEWHVLASIQAWSYTNFGKVFMQYDSEVPGCFDIVFFRILILAFVFVTHSFVEILAIDWLEPG